MTNELQTVDHARSLTLRLIELKKQVGEDFVEAGRIFKEIKENKLWELEGAGSFNSYIAEIGYDRTSAFKMIQVYEVFFEDKSVDSNQQLIDAGWVKLAKLAPHVDENNYEVMVDLSTNSLSDIDKELVRQNYIIRKETDADFVECPYCHKSFVPLKRQDKTFAKEDYTRVIESYQKAKDIELKGKEYEPVQQSIKTMFMNGRTPDQIIMTIEWMQDNAEYEWTINTVKNKIAEIISKVGPKAEPKTELDKEWA
jgi:hypothetical protein